MQEKLLCLIKNEKYKLKFYRCILSPARLVNIKTFDYTLLARMYTNQHFHLWLLKD